MKKLKLLMLSVAGVTVMAGCAGAEGETATVESVAFICGIGSTSFAERYAGVIESGSDTKVQKDDEKKIAEILVKEGDTVEKDQVLFRYDKEQTELNIEKTRIEIEQLKSSMSSKQSEIQTLQNEINSSEIDADTKTSYNLQIQELNADITETGLSVTAKEKELENLQNTLNNLEVKSPDEGTIQSINEGENSEEKAFIVIRKTSAFRVKGYVNETNKNSLYEGMDVLIRSRIDDNLQKGSIKTIDLKSPVSGASTDIYTYGESDDTQSSSKYPFYIDLENTEGFIMGQHVYIEPDYGQADTSEDSLHLPSYYINEAESSPWVWARNDKERLEKRSLTLGEYDSDMDAYEVKSGLSADDYIAVPDETLKAGMKCVEFDFTSDDGGAFYIEDGGSGGDFTFTDDGEYIEDGGSIDENGGEMVQGPGSFMPGMIPIGGTDAVDAEVQE